jgi:hypothetical protein
MTAEAWFAEVCEDATRRFGLDCLDKAFAFYFTESVAS